MKTCNFICLVCWIIYLLLAIAFWIMDTKATPLMVISPTIICIAHYISEIVRDNKNGSN